ncbi:MAG: hypothetical protein DHS20C11_13290 [Lysobacteraceae bacterium]|nr:MAG: hypothetical protein DHS20C11_13290 [Xanthomonadaceae bacterium]
MSNDRNIRTEAMEYNIVPVDTDRVRMNLAYFVLGFVALYVSLAAFAMLYGAETPDARASALEAIFGLSDVLLPLATLVLGYYFGSSGTNNGEGS